MQSYEAPQACGVSAHASAPASAPAESPISELVEDVIVEDVETWGHWTLASDLDAEQTVLAMRWAVQGLIPMDAVAVLYGAAYTGKTGLTVHLASCFVSGTTFFGYAVEPMAVCYLALENLSDVKAHILAVQKEKGSGWTWPRLLAISDKNVDLGRRDDADSIVADVHRMTGGAPAVLIVDALLDGIGDRDITSNAELGPVMRNVHAIAQGIHGPVVIVHHANRTQERSVLGASVILTRADVHVRVEATKKGSSWIAEKVKGGIKSELHSFGFKPVPLGQNSAGQEVTSCVVVEGAEAKTPKAKASKSAQKATNPVSESSVPADPEEAPPAPAHFQGWRTLPTA